MIALVVFAVCGLYLLVSMLAVYGTFRKARKLGFNPWFPAVVVALCMYLLVFWDFIPVLIKHHDLCTEQGGFWICKTPEQWFKENPDAIGKNWAEPGKYLRTEQMGNGSRSWISDYIYEESYLNTQVAHAIKSYEYRMVDAKTGNVLARMVDFERGGSNPMLHADSITDYKFWLSIGDNTCNVISRRKFIQDINSNIQKFYQLGGGNK